VDRELQQRRGPRTQLERTEGARFRTIVGSNEDGVFGFSREGSWPHSTLEHGQIYTTVEMKTAFGQAGPRHRQAAL
jgi:hypothetical protein